MKSFLQSFFLMLIAVSSVQAMDSSPVATSKVKSESDSILYREKVFPKDQVSEVKNHNSFNTIVCHDTTVLYVYPGIPKEVHRHHVLDHNTSSGSGFSSAVITFEDEFGQEYPDTRFNFDEIGLYIIGKATLLSNGKTCMTRILLDSCPYYQFCDTLCSSFPGVQCEDGVFSQLKWPCDITLTECSGPAPIRNDRYTPIKLAEMTGLEISNFSPKLNNLLCQDVQLYYTDEIVDLPEFKIINRTFRVVHQDINESRSYTQVITIPLIPLEICDFLPRDAPLGDCLSGHSDQDMIEWPADIEIIDTSIRLTYLEAIYLNGWAEGYEDVKPQFHNVCTVAKISHHDELVEINDTSQITKRIWTVFDPITDSEYSYVQTINHILYYKAQICVSDIFGNRITSFNLQNLHSSMSDTIYYNNAGCIEIIMDRLSGEQFTIFADSLGLPQSMKGVNIVDVIAIMDHYSKLKEFDNKLSVISGRNIGALDLRKKMRRIAGFPEDTVVPKWIIVDTTKSYPTYDDPESHSIFRSTVSLEYPYSDLILTKSGDVNFSEQKGEITNGEYKISLQDEIVNMGELYRIPFLISEDSELRAYQLEFNNFRDELNQISWINLNNNSWFYTSPENIAFPDKEVVIRRFTESEPIERKSGDTLVTLEFRALKNGVLSEMLTLYPSENNLAVMPIGQLPKKIVIDWKDRIINNNVQEIELEKISLFPNPASEYLEIRGITSIINYQITDLLGKVCLEGVVSEDAKLNVTNLQNGMYVLTMMNSTGARKSFKFFVNH